MTPMTIRYHRGLAVAELVIGALLALTSILTGQGIGTAAGGILVALGVLMLVNPMAKVEPGEIQIRNPLGMTLKRYAIASPADLRIDGKSLRQASDGKKIMGLGFGVDARDAAALRSQVTGQMG
ncbi:hypothetical protein BHE97_00690 [Aeromicrobium sp. PE09-221]|uniref:hypothetical protein n=1 Tax=Aeromicrobium sp. PE09-221 TaxID=1898043 RepID=UPI000B3ECEC0|nr:hypothetical protein [Aeromicrobium sp. PE09-221]OUZ12763.1 hypothetical protein BHE97_00690 [Aeromicrobium sp. PE09-221]